MKHSFGSDNHSGVHPLIMEAIVNENSQFKVAYGEDSYTIDVLKQIETLLGGNCSAYFVLNGTGANVVSLATFCHTYNSILAPNTAHICVDECGAVERATGAKIIPIPCKDGKVTPQDVKNYLTGFGFQHHSQPKILSISQPTELGTLYTTQEVKELADLMHKHNCFIHIDGSRISNAAASMQLSLKEITADCNIDVLSFGGTKNGLLIGEAVVVFNRSNENIKAAEKLKYLRKQSTQLYSKNRFIAAQFKRYLLDNLYLKMAAHSNAMAKYLADSIKELPNITISKKVESNAVFATIPTNVSNKLREKHYFYTWDESINEVRWMCSFNTTKEDIDQFVADLKALL